MTNRCYKPGALRIACNERGQMFLANERGQRIPRQVWTRVYQDTRQSFSGVCTCTTEVYLITYDAIEITSPTSFRFMDAEYQAETVELIEGGPDESPRALITCIAYHDPTI